ncbi:selenium-binding protein SBP56-related protein [Methylopila sp. M107]|uniref:selenium-binding protein SBP56-related protein n=1 Tax=Methylopila sp. M107 TaxID=1101190 RepID=UPI00037C9793|nr:selenium-binding protein SBP56-related protein [Methylopila sp. M107]
MTVLVENWMKPLAAAAAAAAALTLSQPAQAEDTLYVWAGDKAHKAADFFAVVDFDKGSPTYGKILSYAPLPKSLPSAIVTSNGSIGNEPHHVGISADKKTLAGGGLLSVLRVQNSNFFWDISNPRAPKFLKANTLPVVASIADAYVPKKEGGFFTTFMGGAGGAAPGRVVEYDANNNVKGLWPLVPPLDGFNPHGIAIDEERNLLLTSDFVCPLQTLNLVPGVANGHVHARGSVRVWDLSRRKITKTIPVGDPNHAAGTIDLQLVPKDPKLRAFTAGVFDEKLYLIEPGAGTAQPVFDLSTFKLPGAPEVWPHLIAIDKTGKRLALTLNYKGLDGKVVWFNIEDPEHPKVINVVDLGQNSGPHYIIFSPTEDRLIVSDYFLVQDLFPSGVVQVEGDHKVHVLDIVKDRLVKDPKFKLDFSRDVASGPARPHGLGVVSR